MWVVRRRRRKQARQAGIAVGIAGLGALIPTGSAFGLDPTAYVAGMHRALWVACAIAAGGAAVSALLFSSEGKCQS
jgi:hypothetical protein